MTSLSNSNDMDIILDFSVLREGDEMLLQSLQSAIRLKHTVQFTYTNNNNETRIHTVEPIAVIYRWYAWYLLAYSIYKKDYRSYKLVRMSSLEVTDIPFTKAHESAAAILKKTDKTDSRSYTTVLVKCRKAVITKVKEYLNGKIITEYKNGDVDMELTIVENEQFWFGMLLSLGNNVEIIQPRNIRERVLDAASKIVSLYGEL